MIKFLRSVILKHWPYYLSGLIALIITTYVTTLIPLKLKDVINTLQFAHDGAAITALIKQIILLALILAASRTLSRILIFIPGRLVEYDLRNTLYKTLMRLGRSYFRGEKIGDIMSRLTNDIQSLRLTAALGFLHVCNTVMMYAIVFYQMLLIHAKLTLLVIAPIPIIMIIVRYFVKQLHYYISNNQKKLGEVTNYFVETLGSIRIIKSYVAEQAILEDFDSLNRDYFSFSLGQARIRSTMFPFIGIIGSLGQCVLFVYGGYLIIEGVLTLGDFVAMTAYIMMLAWPTASLAWIINIVQRGKVSLERINDILNAKNELILQSPTSRITLNTAPKISLKSLNFSYGDTALFNNLSLEIKPGETIGIFGPTGCGKSTLASILARLEPCEASTYFINDTDICDISLENAHSLISYVPQQTFLFSESIKDTVQYANGGDTDSLEAVKAKTDAAKVTSDIEKFPNGFDTIVGEKGVILSGGQKSRISLARALYQSHPFIILDDVLAAVDHKTEVEMIDTLSAELSSKTALIISHRISALRMCDRVLILNEGRIVDEGTHDELISREGLYQSTWQYQKEVSHS